MSEFEAFLKMGFHHISDFSAYDHILFIVALCAVYDLKDWKRILILVTAFTVGHTLTLGLAVYDQVNVPAQWIELLIPVTIMITSGLHLIFKRSSFSIWAYFLTLFFGLIHGLGFSNFLKSVMVPGQDHSILWQLFAFNLGVEFGQLLIVILILILSTIVLQFFKYAPEKWTLAISVTTFLLSFHLFFLQLVP